MRRVRRLSLFLVAVSALLLGTVWAVQGANHLKITVDSGTHQFSIGEQAVQISTSAPVVVYLSIENQNVNGVLELPPGSQDIPHVTLTLLGPPDEVIFEGKVTTQEIIEAVYPTETGHTEF